MLDVISALSASAAAVLFDFNSSLLPEAPAKTVSVPEPAAASLNLLGLAALMVRRRIA